MRTLGLFALVALLASACAGRQPQVQSQEQASTTYKCPSYSYNTNVRCTVN